MMRAFMPCRTLEDLDSPLTSEQTGGHGSTTAVARRPGDARCRQLLTRRCAERGAQVQVTYLVDLVGNVKSHHPRFTVAPPAVLRPPQLSEHRRRASVVNLLAHASAYSRPCQ